jgi:type IV pilus assembly protein PilX
MMRGTRLGRTLSQPRPGQRGIALITALLLLLVITILGLSMFRSFPTQEKIAGNVREKGRAVHAANSALQFAEWWLINNVSSGDVVCGVQAQLLNGNAPVPEGQICSNPLYTLPPQPAGLVPSVTNVPWLGGLTGVKYIPPGMTVGTGNPILTAGDSAYAGAPVFYIADLGAAGDAQGEAYQIDAYAYGGSTTTVAVVESIYEVQQGVVNRTGE